MPDLGKTQKFTLVGVKGSEWVVAFTRNALRAGWKVFATDHRLEKGDMIMFTLIAPKRFSVCVFDSSGEEKFGTFSNSRDSLSTVINTTLPLGPRNKTLVSNYTSGADGAPPCTPTPTHTLKPYDDVCSPSSEKTSDDDETLMSLSRKRALKEKDHLPHEPGVRNRCPQPIHSLRFSLLLTANASASTLRLLAPLNFLFFSFFCFDLSRTSLAKRLNLGYTK